MRWIQIYYSSETLRRKGRSESGTTEIQTSRKGTDRSFPQAILPTDLEMLPSFNYPKEVDHRRKEKKRWLLPNRGRRESEDKMAMRIVRSLKKDE